jgi:hypothetical protein
MDLVKTIPYSYNATYANGGSGYAQGIELFGVIKTFKDFDYWISYSIWIQNASI